MKTLPLAMLSFMVPWSAAMAAPAPKLNVVLIISDDLNCDLGCYGAAGLQTPNIDRLAGRGVLFDHAYCQFPLCSPSRSSFLSGRRPNVTGVLTNPRPKTPMSPNLREKIPDTITLPQAFKRGGWFAARVGKLYHYGVPADIGTSSLDDYPSWDQVINPRGRDREEQEKIFSLRPGELGSTLSWLADDEGEDNDHTDGVGATEAIRLLERFKREARPYFLAVGFYRPHTPFVAPKKFFDLYPLDKIVLPPLSADDRTRSPAPAFASSHPEQDSATDDQRRQAIQAYHATTSFMDEQVGRLVDALDRLGLAQNTVIVFMSDHGYHLGDHGLWQKRSLFERSARVPLIIAVPGTKSGGQVAHHVVELVDLYPTLAGLCGVKPPEYLDGVSLQPMLEDPAKAVKAMAISQTRWGTSGDGFAVTDGHWRYVEWSDGSQQLYDEERDPAEVANVVADPANSAVIAEFHTRIQRERERR